MGAETTVYVKVEKIVTDWIELSAVSLNQAIDQVEELSEIHKVLRAQYDKPGGEI